MHDCVKPNSSTLSIIISKNSLMINDQTHSIQTRSLLISRVPKNSIHFHVAITRSNTHPNKHCVNNNRPPHHFCILLPPLIPVSRRRNSLLKRKYWHNHNKMQILANTAPVEGRRLQKCREKDSFDTKSILRTKRRGKGKKRNETIAQILCRRDPTTTVKQSASIIWRVLTPSRYYPVSRSSEEGRSKKGRQNSQSLCDPWYLPRYSWDEGQFSPKRANES